jgi:signal transduction histidine kinase/AmiR/NasT family two-component response regulator
VQPWYRSADATRAWDALPYGVCLVDERHGIVAWNAALRSWTGRPAEAVVGTPLDAAFPPLRELGVLDAIDDVLRTGETWTGCSGDVAYFPCLAGRRHAAVPTVQELRIEICSAERPMALISVFDATAHARRVRAADDDARRRAFNDVAVAQQILEVQARELREKNHELHDAREKAEAAARAKSDFLANMSHEIRTPMTAILGFADLLLNEEGLDRAPPQRREAIETIQRNGEHLLGVINDILDVSKIESGKMTSETIACSPFQIVEDVVALMRVRVAERGLQLLKEYRFPIPAQIHSDPTRLRQILMNLVGNAIKFTDEGSVTIRTSFAADPAPRLSFEVIDTGVGIPPELTPKLFLPFSQADSSTTRKYGGTGLGLTICKRLSEMLGGGISLTSTPGQGSNFTFWVDAGDLTGVAMRDCERSEVPVPPPLPFRGRRGSDRLPGCRILLAEDGPDNQRLISFLLRKAGTDVTIVDNGLAAVDAVWGAAAAGNPFDLVLMDMQMPIMDGYEATAALRRRGYTRPIIALTANAMSGDRDRCLAAGCDEFATKPIEKRRLFETIIDALRHLPLTEDFAADAAEPNPVGSQT